MHGSHRIMSCRRCCPIHAKCFYFPARRKESAAPRSGIGTVAANKGQYFDPWGAIITVVRIDADYNNQVVNPYTANAGATPLQIGVIAWSLGADPSWWLGEQKFRRQR